MKQEKRRYSECTWNAIIIFILLTMHIESGNSDVIDIEKPDINDEIQLKKIEAEQTTKFSYKVKWEYKGNESKEFEVKLEIYTDGKFQIIKKTNLSENEIIFGSLKPGGLYQYEITVLKNNKINITDKFVQKPLKPFEIQYFIKDQNIDFKWKLSEISHETAVKFYIKNENDNIYQFIEDSTVKSSQENSYAYSKIVMGSSYRIELRTVVKWKTHNAVFSETAINSFTAICVKTLQFDLFKDILSWQILNHAAHESTSMIIKNILEKKITLDQDLSKSTVKYSFDRNLLAENTEYEFQIITKLKSNGKCLKSITKKTISKCLDKTHKIKLDSSHSIGLSLIINQLSENQATIPKEKLKELFKFCLKYTVNQKICVDPDDNANVKFESNLDPATCYVAELSSNFGWKLCDSELNKKKWCTLPNCWTDFQASIQTDSSITLAWKLTTQKKSLDAYKIIGRITYFDLKDKKIDLDSSKVNELSTKLQYKFDGLSQSATSYNFTFTLFIENSNQICNKIFTAITAPLPPILVKTVENDFLTRTLFWKTKEMQVNEFLISNELYSDNAYNLILNDRKVMKVHKYQLTKLAAARLYRFSIVSLYKDIKSKPLIDTFTQKPKIPKNFVIDNIKADSVTISWDFEKYLNYALLILYLNDENNNKLINSFKIIYSKKPFTISNLKPGRSYKIEVQTSVKWLNYPERLSEKATKTFTTKPLCVNTLDFDVLRDQLSWKLPQDNVFDRISMIVINNESKKTHRNITLKNMNWIYSFKPNELNEVSEYVFQIILKSGSVAFCKKSITKKTINKCIENYYDTKLENQSHLGFDIKLIKKPNILIPKNNLQDENLFMLALNNPKTSEIINSFNGNVVKYRDNINPATCYTVITKGTYGWKFCEDETKKEKWCSLPECIENISIEKFSASSVTFNLQKIKASSSQTKLNYRAYFAEYNLRDSQFYNRTITLNPSSVASTSLEISKLNLSGSLYKFNFIVEIADFPKLNCLITRTAITEPLITTKEVSLNVENFDFKINFFVGDEIIVEINAESQIQACSSKKMQMTFKNQKLENQLAHNSWLQSGCKYKLTFRKRTTVYSNSISNELTLPPSRFKFTSQTIDSVFQSENRIHLKLNLPKFSSERKLEYSEKIVVKLIKNAVVHTKTKTLFPGNSENFLFENLDSSSGYILSAQKITVDGVTSETSTFSKEIFTFGPVSIISKENLTSRSIDLSWKMPENFDDNDTFVMIGRIVKEFHFEVYARNPSSDPATFTTVITNKKLGNLQPGTFYEVRVWPKSRITNAVTGQTIGKSIQFWSFDEIPELNDQEAFKVVQENNTKLCINGIPKINTNVLLSNLNSFDFGYIQAVHMAILETSSNSRCIKSDHVFLVCPESNINKVEPRIDESPIHKNITLKCSDHQKYPYITSPIKCVSRTKLDSALVFDYLSLQPHAHHEILFAKFNRAGWSSTYKIANKFLTEEVSSDAVQDFGCIQPNLTYNTLICTWSLPKHLTNSFTNEYQLKLISPANLVLIDIAVKDSQRINITDSLIKPDITYKVSICAKNKIGCGCEKTIFKKLNASTEPSYVIGKEKISSLIQEAVKKASETDKLSRSKRSSQIYFELPKAILNEDSGKIQFASLVLLAGSKEKYEKLMKNKNEFFSVKSAGRLSIQPSGETDSDNAFFEVPIYIENDSKKTASALNNQTEPLKSDTNIQLSRAFSDNLESNAASKVSSLFPNNPISYIIGANGKCKNVSSESNVEYCNYPLKQSQQYVIAVRFYTGSGFDTLDPIIVETEISLTIIIVLVVVLIVLLFGIAIFFIYIALRPIGQARILINSFNRLLENQESFKSIPSSLAGVDITEACKNENTSKNKFSDVLPYDWNRVKLQININADFLEAVDNFDDNYEYIIEQTDYFNGSCLSSAAGYPTAYRYIATQAPLESTKGDFWSVIWDYNVKIICNLLNLIDPCPLYYPEVNASFRYIMTCGRVFEVYTEHEEVTQNGYTIRKFRVENVENGRTATKSLIQLHFTVWPDHGVPTDYTQMRSYLEEFQHQINQLTDVDLIDPRNYPVLVHCRAGVGRTGTLIFLIEMLHEIEVNRSFEDNALNKIRLLRMYRMRLVDNLEQFGFVLSFLLQVLKKKTLIKKLFARFSKSRRADQYNTDMIELGNKY